MSLARPILVRALARVPVIGNIVTKLDDIRLGTTYSLRSRYSRNPRSARAFDANKPALSGAQAKVVNDLKQCGIAVTHFRDLFGDDALWNTLCVQMNEFVKSSKVNEKLQAAAQQKEPAGKDHLIRLFDPHQTKL